VYDADNTVIGETIGEELPTLSFFDTVAQGLLPNVSFVDPAFDTEGNGTSADDHPLADIRLGERFISDVYYALSNGGYLDNTVLIVTFDEWGGFYDHVPPPTVIDDTNPANVSTLGDTTATPNGQTRPNYGQLGFRVPAIVVSNLAPVQVVGGGPFEHCSTLALIESTFGLNPLTARDTNAQNLGQVLLSTPRTPVASGVIPTSSQVLGPVSDAAAICSADSVQSVSPAPLNSPVAGLPEAPEVVALPVAAAAVGGMVALGRHYRKVRAEAAATTVDREAPVPPASTPDTPATTLEGAAKPSSLTRGTELPR